MKNQILQKPYLSLCIPTNGVTEWVLPVLESIYNQKVDETLFEVIVEDNGNNEDFYNAVMKVAEKHTNLVYNKTDAQRFLCQIESFKAANGVFVKFINHRAKMNEGSIEYLISFVKENMELPEDEWPIIFFSNTTLKKCEDVQTMHSFDAFVGTMSYWSSWSGGLAFWKKDFDKLPENMEYNDLFPHISVLFSIKEAKNYIVDNTWLLTDIETGHQAKGKYNLFYAFGVEYPKVIEKLWKEHEIEEGTFLKIKKELADFLGGLYFDFVIRKKPCSYDLTDYKKHLSCYYSVGQIRRKSIMTAVCVVLKKLKLMK